MRGKSLFIALPLIKVGGIHSFSSSSSSTAFRPFLAKGITAGIKTRNLLSDKRKFVTASRGVLYNGLRGKHGTMIVKKRRIN
jgi:hypothetical protein